MELTSINKAAMICDTPYTRLLYAVGENLIDYARVGKHIVVNPSEVQRKLNEGVILPITYMIRRSLCRSGVWEDSWADHWEAVEAPMTEMDYLDWIKEKVAICGEDKTMGCAEKEYWASLGYDF